MNSKSLGELLAASSAAVAGPAGVIVQFRDSEKIPGIGFAEGVGNGDGPGCHQGSLKIIGFEGNGIGAGNQRKGGPPLGIANPCQIQRILTAGAPDFVDIDPSGAFKKGL